tara:strand:- start:135 stop:368 length:234 start_codon:yes stop_codon:yes gene_type:complete
MIDTDKYEETDHPELVEFEGETLGDTLTNLLAEVKRLRENLKRIRHTVFYDIEENFTDEQAYDPVLIEIMEKIQAVL